MMVTVIIPVYQAERYMEECLRSVMEQTLPDIEIICIDDRSSDGSREIVSRLAGEDPRIHLYVNKKNLGPGATRNLGLDLAKGKYIYFLDCDDRIRRETLQELVETAERDALDVCIFEADFLYENKGLEESFHKNPARFKGSYPDVMTGKNVFKAWMKVWDWIPAPPRYFYKRSFLMENGIRFAEGVQHEDEMFAFDVLMNAERVRVLCKAYYFRRFREGSIMTSTPTMENVKGCVEIIAHLHEYTNHQNLKETDKELADGILFYESKILATAVGKYKTVIAHGQADCLPEEKIPDASGEEIFQKIRMLSQTEATDGRSN